jgi:hypothetical protein
MPEPPAPPAPVAPDPWIASGLARVVVSYLPPLPTAPDDRPLAYGGPYDFDTPFSQHVLVSYADCLWQPRRPGYLLPPFVSTTPDVLPAWNTREWLIVAALGLDPDSGAGIMALFWPTPPSDAWVSDVAHPRQPNDAWVNWDSGRCWLFSELAQPFGTAEPAPDAPAAETPPDGSASG